MKLNMCPKCAKHSLRHMHDTAHGITGTHMDGSERFECDCGFYVGDAKEGARWGLKFDLDIETSDVTLDI